MSNSAFFFSLKYLFPFIYDGVYVTSLIKVTKDSHATKEAEIHLSAALFFEW